jgi:hypothetical protein
MAHVRFAELQSRPTEFLDFTSLTLDEFQALVPPFEALSKRIWPRGVSMGNRGPPAGLPCTKTVRSQRQKSGCCLFWPM